MKFYQQLFAELKRRRVFRVAWLYGIVRFGVPQAAVTSPEGDQAYFSDGITEEILNTLAKIRELKVAARTSAFAFKGRQLDLRTGGAGGTGESGRS